MKNLSKGLLMAALITGSLAAVPAYAAEVETFALDPMVVTASRMETKDLQTPASTTVITAKDIENSGAKTVYEIIERQVGLTDNAYGPGGREFGGSCSRMVLRGLDKATLVMVNGAPINMMNYNNPNGIPVQAIEKVEVVRGAQSVMYGAEATGGVINIITKKGGAPKTTLTVGAGNYDKKWGVTSVGEKYVVAISKDYYGDVGQTNKVFEKSTRIWKYRNSTKSNAFVSISPMDKLSLNYAHTEGNYYRDDYTLKNFQTTGAGTIYHYKDTRDNLSAVYDDKDNLFKAVVSYNSREVDPYSAKMTGYKLPDMARGTSSDWKIDTFTTDVQKGWNLNNDADTVLVGATYTKENVKDRTKKDKGDRDSFAGYASYKHAFSDKFDATVGVRALHVSDNYSHVDGKTASMNKVLPQIQMLYKVDDNNSFYANAGKSFQLPPLNNYFGKSNYKAKDLKPQEGWTYEAGWKHISDSSSLKADIFYMDVDAKFDWTPKDADGNQYLINAGTFRNLGFEVEYRKALGDRLAYNVGAYIANPKTKATDKGAYSQSEAKVQLTAGVDYKVGKLTSNLNWLFVGKRENAYYNSLGQSASTYGADHRVPNRSLLNANFTYKANEHHSVSLLVNNIFDKHDTINKYENWGMPANYMVTYNFSF